MNALFPVVIWELVVGGGGRVLAVGPASLRMLLFLIAVVMWITLAIRAPQRTSNERLALHLLMLFFFSHVPGTLQGVFDGVKLSNILGEIQPLLYWFMAPFLALCLSRIENVDRAARIIMRGGVISAVISLVVLGGMAAGVIPFSAFYAWATATQEVFFRGVMLFFYKGFFYVTVAVIFLVALRPRHWAVWAVILTLTIGLSLTRGLLLGLVLGLLVVLVAQRRWRVLGVGIGLSLVLGVVLSGAVSLTSVTEMGNRASSVSQRVDDTLFIVKEMKPVTILFGEGMGSLINMRRNIENTYMWALWRLGVTGLIFWLLPLGLSVWYFLRVPFASPRYDLAAAFMGGVVMLHMVTATNPFLNNSIGLSYMMIALFGLRTLALDPANAALPRRAAGAQG